MTISRPTFRPNRGLLFVAVVAGFCFAAACSNNKDKEQPTVEGAKEASGKEKPDAKKDSKADPKGKKADKKVSKADKKSAKADKKSTKTDKKVSRKPASKIPSKVEATSKKADTASRLGNPMAHKKNGGLIGPNNRKEIGAIAKNPALKPKAAIDGKAKSPFAKSPPSTNIGLDKAKKVADLKNTKEKAKTTAPPPTNGARDLANVLTRNDVKLATGYKGLLRPAPLPGIEASKNYTSIRLRPSGTSGYGAGIQVWSVNNAGQQTRKFNEFMNQYPKSARSQEMGDSAFAANFSSVRYFVWLDRKQKLLVAVTCDEDVCKSEKEVVKLARRLNTKLPGVFRK